MNLDDNCDELETLRYYRYILIKEDENFRNQVLDYYRKAPVIVQKIMEIDEKDKVLYNLYHNLVEKCVTLLKKGDLEEAKQHLIVKD